MSRIPFSRVPAGLLDRPLEAAVVGDMEEHVECRHDVGRCVLGRPALGHIRSGEAIVRKPRGEAFSRDFGDVEAERQRIPSDLQ